MEQYKKESIDRYLLEFRNKDLKKLEECFGFMIHCVDDGVNNIEPLPISGPDKKAVVLSIICGIYAEVIAKNLPLYLKPFNILIEFILIQVIISKLIDFIVDKYNKGLWRKES